MAVIEVARFADLQEAEVAASFLASHGVVAYVADRNLATIDPLMQRALGLRVMVPHHQLTAARGLLARAATGEFFDDEGDDIERPSGGTGLASAAVISSLLLPEAGLATTGLRQHLSGLRILGLLLVAAFILQGGTLFFFG